MLLARRKQNEIVIYFLFLLIFFFAAAADAVFETYIQHDTSEHSLVQVLIKICWYDCGEPCMSRGQLARLADVWQFISYLYMQFDNINPRRIISNSTKQEEEKSKNS